MASHHAQNLSSTLINLQLIRSLEFLHGGSVLEWPNTLAPAARLFCRDGIHDRSDICRHPAAHSADCGIAICHHCCPCVCCIAVSMLAYLFNQALGASVDGMRSRLGCSGSVALQFRDSAFLLPLDALVGKQREWRHAAAVGGRYAC